MERLVKVFKTLGDESRLRVLSLLMERECCVCEVMQATGYSQSKASRVLTALREAGFLSLRKEGLWSLYSIDRAGMKPYLAAVLDALAEALHDNPQLAADRGKLRAAERSAPGCSAGACRGAAIPGSNEPRITTAEINEKGVCHDRHTRMDL